MFISTEIFWIMWKPRFFALLMGTKTKNWKRSVWQKDAKINVNLVELKFTKLRRWENMFLNPKLKISLQLCVNYIICNLDFRNIPWTLFLLILRWCHFLQLIASLALISFYYLCFVSFYFFFFIFFLDSATCWSKWGKFGDT